MPSTGRRRTRAVSSKGMHTSCFSLSLQFLHHPITASIQVLQTWSTIYQSWFFQKQQQHPSCNNIKVSPSSIHANKVFRIRRDNLTTPKCARNLQQRFDCQVVWGPLPGAPNSFPAQLEVRKQQTTLLTLTTVPQPPKEVKAGRQQHTTAHHYHHPYIAH